MNLVIDIFIEAHMPVTKNKFRQWSRVQHTPEGFSQRHLVSPIFLISVQTGLIHTWIFLVDWYRLKISRRLLICVYGSTLITAEDPPSPFPPRGGRGPDTHPKVTAYIARFMALPKVQAYYGPGLSSGQGHPEPPKGQGRWGRPVWPG